MPKGFNRGGQRRTIQFVCGQSVCGHPTEVNSKYERHMRICETCKLATSAQAKMPSFDTVAGCNNGWKGYKGGNERPTEIISTVQCEGMMFSLTSEANSIQENLKKLDDPNYRLDTMDKSVKGFANIGDRDTLLTTILESRKSAEEMGVELRTCNGISDAVIKTYDLKKLRLIRSLIVEELMLVLMG